MSLGSDQASATGVVRQQRTAPVVKAFIAALVLFAGLSATLFSLRTGSARISGATENAGSVFAAAELSLAITAPDSNTSVELLFDSDGLYPGLTVERCLRITYRGSIGGVDIRLFGQRAGGNGLDEFVKVNFEVGTGRDAECADFEEVRPLFNDTLFELWDGHPSFERGLEVAHDAASGSATTLRVTATVADDNAAQGLDAEFWVVVEARP